MTLNKKLANVEEQKTFVSRTASNQTKRSTPAHKPCVKKDLDTIVFLIFVYFLQAIPLGLDRSIPMILGSRKITYGSQGTFSLAFWPFSVKLLWAPFVDTWYSKRLGRRRSWILPMNFSIGLFFLGFAKTANDLLYNGQNQTGIPFSQLFYTGPLAQTNTNIFFLIDIILLTMIFLILTFLAATQDVCVDGWAISLLSKENVSWQSTCNNVGFLAGNLVSNTCFVILESAWFCNQYIRPIFGLASQNYGIIGLESKRRKHKKNIPQIVNFFRISYFSWTKVSCISSELFLYLQRYSYTFTKTSGVRLICKMMKQTMTARSRGIYLSTGRIKLSGSFCA
jgi:hypothetical protein